MSGSSRITKINPTQMYSVNSGINASFLFPVSDLQTNILEGCLPQNIDIGIQWIYK